MPLKRDRVATLVKRHKGRRARDTLRARCDGLFCVGLGLVSSRLSQPRTSCGGSKYCSLCSQHHDPLRTNCEKRRVPHLNPAYEKITTKTLFSLPFAMRREPASPWGSPGTLPPPLVPHFPFAALTLRFTARTGHGSATKGSPRIFTKGQFVQITNIQRI